MVETQDRRMSEMVERVARAIDPSIWANWDYWTISKAYNDAEKAEEFAASPSLRGSLEKARIAIEAMREPTDEMRKAFKFHGMLDGDFDEALGAMIDAALAPPSEE